MYVIEEDVLVLAAEETAAETEHEPSGTELLFPKTGELILGAAAFLIVLLVLTKYAFPKIKQAMADRESAVRSSLEQAEAAKAEAARERQEFETQLAASRSEAGRIVEDARGQAEQVRRDLVAKAEKEAEAIVSRAREQIEAERVRAMQELKGTVATLSVELAEKVVGRSLDQAAHKDFVNSYINEVAGMGNGRS